MNRDISASLDPRPALQIQVIPGFCDRELVILCVLDIEIISIRVVKVRVEINLSFGKFSNVRSSEIHPQLRRRVVEGVALGPSGHCLWVAPGEGG
jgi:hypothetical protein